MLLKRSIHGICRRAVAILPNQPRIKIRTTTEGKLRGCRFFWDLFLSVHFPVNRTQKERCHENTSILCMIRAIKSADSAPIIRPAQWHGVFVLWERMRRRSSVCWFVYDVACFYNVTMFFKLANLSYTFNWWIAAGWKGGSLLVFFCESSNEINFPKFFIRRRFACILVHALRDHVLPCMFAPPSPPEAPRHALAAPPSLNHKIKAGALVWFAWDKK